ncbi:precorrin-3B synthase [Rhodobacteraceae bacterium HSP-20]|uniref:Precorrin-3B synthase n=1 Tax=Paragemmobacter amnigenus TaxID=2852097 RepID=A0ABS6J5S7_9RHOB|nr:precorrin-3B synthase [Rhodobacter amnigenus]MBU9698958.1 precorrin-3B synthase [Rhodobacter amnigenus]MBV4390185.1 precorrin-3B synthase [Rhodobacter amnigenus]
MTGFAVQGWCPGALRPMLSGDGLVVRVRPDAGRLSAVQAQGIAAAARTHGNGLIDLSARGNVQLRGATGASHPALIADLSSLGLIDATARDEARRNILVTPFADAATDALAQALAAALCAAPELPGKFGFAIDCGPAPILQGIAADIRLERDATGGLILRCDGLAAGAPVTAADAAPAAVALAQWFVDAGGITAGRGRMAALIARGARPKGRLAPRITPAPSAPAPGPGLCPQGALVGFEFGQMTAETLAALAGLGNLRVTPWRMLLIEGLDHLPSVPGLILDPTDPLLRVAACTGAPGCLQAHQPVRPLARRLAAQVPSGKLLHVSGCAKGCARPGPADITLVATPQGFDLIRQASAQGTPLTANLADPDIDLKGLF